MIPATSKDITSNWLNDVLHASGFLENTDIESIAHEPMGKGEGFVSDMARITLKYDRDTPQLPKTVIAKLPTTFESADEVAGQFNLYETEIRFYSEIAGRSPIRTPGLIYWDMDSESGEYVLILEDCARYTQIDQIKGLDYGQTKQVALRVADFHASWWDAEELSSFDWMLTAKSPAAIALPDAYRAWWDAAVQSEDFVRALPEGGREAGLQVYKHFPWLLESIPDNHMTIIHGDLRVDNLFFDFDNPEDPVVAFDWQTLMMFRGVADLAYLLGGSVTIELRRKIQEEIVRLYYDRLLEKGVSGYPFDECWNDYLIGTLFYAHIPVVLFSSLDTSDERGRQLACVLTERHFASIVDNDATRVLP